VRVDSKFFKKLVISQAVLDVDFIVNLPKLKTHALTLFTLGVKNMFGILAGTSKSRVHSTASDLEDFGEALADIYQIRPPDLTIIDGVVGMDGNGPSHGRIRDIGYLIASHNAPSCDVVIAELAGVEAERVHHLRCTAERGLGPRKFAEVEIGGTCEPILRFRLPSTLVQTRFVGFAINRYLYRSIINSRLVLSEEKCNTCRNCAEACPRSAMRWDGDRPQIDQEKCIRCLCCFELCPEGAWEIKGPLRRLMGKKI
jgi:ferredoxin